MRFGEPILRETTRPAGQLVRASVFVDQVMEEIEIGAKARAIWDKRKPDDLSSHFAAVKALYKLIEGRAYDAYPCDINIPMTPIERAVWTDIRALNLPFYPQYPVGRFFADFGDPVAKRAIECDGRDFHNAERDDRRDAEFAAMGWDVLRLPGWQCVITDDTPLSPYRVIQKRFG